MDIKLIAFLLCILIIVVYVLLRKRSTSLTSLLKKIDTQIKALDTKSVSIAKAKQIIDDLLITEKQPLLLTVVGEFSAGKSTFINALFGRTILPMRNVETTATITVLQYGEKPKIQIFYNDHRVEEHFIPDDKFSNYYDYLVQPDEDDEKKVEKIESIREVRIHINNQFLKGIDLVDTPGFNSENERHTKLTDEFQRSADTIIWLFRASKVGKKSEIEKMQDYCRHFKPILVFNKIDELVKNGIVPEVELRNKILEFEKLSEKIFLTSAKLGLNGSNGTYNDSRMAEVISYFQSEIIPKAKSKKDGAILNKVIQIGEHISKYFEQQKKIVQNYILTVEKLKTAEKDLKSTQLLFHECTNLFNDHIKKNNKDNSFTLVDFCMNVENYIRLTPISDKVSQSLGKIKILYEEILDKGDELEKVYSQLEISFNSLNLAFSNYERKLLEWQDQHGAGGGGLWGLAINILGDIFSKEKQSINQLAEQYDTKRERYNRDVKSYNLEVSRNEMKMDRVNNLMLDFVNDTLVTEINDQYKVVEEKIIYADSIKSKLKESKKSYQDSLKIINTINKGLKISFEKCKKLIEQRMNLKDTPGFSDFSKLIDHLGKYSSPDLSTDFDKMYRRGKISERFTPDMKVSSQPDTKYTKVREDKRVANKV